MQKVWRVYKKGESAVLIILVGSMGIVLFAQIVVRYFLKTPLLWSEELARYLQVWITFLGIGFGLRTGSHIAMTLVYDKCSKSVRHCLGIFVNIILIVCFAVIIPTAHSFTAYQHGILASTLRIPMSYVTGVVPIAFYICILYSIKDIVQNLQGLLKNKQGD